MAFQKELQAYHDSLSKPLSQAQYRESNPFRGLAFFDAEHAPFFYGRTKAVEELLNVLQQQAAEKKPFVLVLGPEGCGKTSLVRAGILRVLTQAGITDGDRSWRLALTRPADGGSGDPIDALAAALLNESALPELPNAATRDGRQNLAAELREAPEDAALRIRETLQYLSLQALDHFLDEHEASPADPERSVELPRQNKLGRTESKVQLALVVDQLEELFVGGFSPELQQSYIAALGALVKWRAVFVIATLRSDFYASFQKCCIPKDLTVLDQPGIYVRDFDLSQVLTGRFDLHPPSPWEIRDMIRLPAEATGLRFELDPETGRSLEAALLEAATAHPEPLPLLEHLLWQLCRKQLPRKDGLLRWSDYRELGELEGALANHAESVFSELDDNAQAAFKSVIGRLVSPGPGEDGAWIRRTVPYRDLVSTPEFDERQKTVAEGAIERFIKEGLFHAEQRGSNAEVVVSITQECLLRNWPRVRQLLKEDLGLLRARDRLEPNFKLWLSGGRRSQDLLRTGSSIREAKALLRSFRASLSETQVDYFQKSLKAQNRSRRLRHTAVLAAIAGLIAPITIAGLQWLRADIERRKGEKPPGQKGGIAQSVDANRETLQRDAGQGKPKDTDAEQIQKSLELVTSQRDGLQSRLKETEARAEQAQKNAELATSQRDVLQAQLKDAEAKAQLNERNTELATSERDGLRAQLKETETRAQQAQKNAELATSQREALQIQLKDSDTKAQQAQKNAELASSQRVGLQGQLKDTEAKTQQAQKNAELVTNQRDALQAQLKDAEAKAQLNQKNAQLPTSEREALQAQLKDIEARAQQAQNSAELATSQRDALQTRLKETEAEAQQAQKNAELATTQRAALQGQLRDTEAQAQQIQKGLELATSQRDALQAQLKETQAKAQQAQKNAELVTNQRDALQAQLKDAGAKAQQAQKNAELVTNQRDALQSQLKDTEAKTQQAQKNAELATSQRDALQAQLKDAEAKAQLNERNTELATSERDGLRAQLKETETRAQQAQKNAELATSQREALQIQLKDSDTKAQQAQKNAELASSQRVGLQGQLKDTEAKTQQAQKNAELVTNQRDALQAQLKDAEAKAQLNQKNAQLPTSEREALQAQLKDIEARAQQAQNSAELATSQRDALQTRLKETEAEAQQAQKNAELATTQRAALQGQLRDTEAQAQQIQKGLELATSQRDALQAQLKETQAKAQQAQKNAELVTNQRDALQAQLKDAGAKAQQAQKNAELATNERDALQAQLKETQAKMQQAQKNAELVTNQRDALQSQLKDTEAKMQQAQKNAELATSQRDALQTQPETAQRIANPSQQDAEHVVERPPVQEDLPSEVPGLPSVPVPAAMETGSEETTAPPKRTRRSTSELVRHQRVHRLRETRRPRNSSESTNAKAPFLQQLHDEWNRLLQRINR